MSLSHRRERRSSTDSPIPTSKAPPRVTDLAERFVAEYLIDLNATAAYKRANPAIKSDAVAAVSGARMLRNPKVKALVAAGKAKQLAKADISATRVLEELRRVAFVDPIGFVNEDDSLKRLREMTPEVRSCIQQLEVAAVNFDPTDGKTTYGHKVKFLNKLQALELLCRNLGLLENASQQEVVDGLMARLVRGRERNAKRK